MICVHAGCLASFEWIGDPNDKPLVEMAKERGWKLMEGSGWACPHHVRRATAAIRQLDRNP